jgi:HAMP domain-containing protein
MLRVVRRLALVILTILSASCAEPPSKEMNQAQGAIDAARAAGAERFAAAELTAATDALKRSEEAVAAGDYRQALSHAIDSRDRAQSAAKMAVDGRADARGHAERAVAEVATLLDRAQAQIKAGENARLSPRILREPQATVTAAEKMLQEARAALKREDYPNVTKSLNGAAGELQAALRMIDSALSPRPAPRKR